GPVRTVDDRQGRAVGLDVQQRRLRIVGPVSDRLGQRGRGQEGRDQHHILDLVGGQLVAQRGGLGGVGEGDSRRRQLITALGRALPGAQDGRNYLVGRGNRCCITRCRDVEVIFIDGRPIPIFALDQHHSD